MKQKNGAILVFTLVILSIVTLVTQQLVQSTFVSSYFTQTVVDREHAQMLALGGIHLAMVQLSPKVKQQKGQTTDEKKVDPQEQAKKELLKNILPHLNRWQSFPLYKEIDGVEGEIKICITSEEGKININEAFDFGKAEFKKEAQLLLGSIAIKGKLPKGIIIKKITDFFKTRKRKLDDISELIEISDFKNLDVFYLPPQEPHGKQKAEPNTTVFLQDLFTIWTKEFKVQPLLLSDSLCGLLSLRRPLADDATKIKDKFKEITDNFKLEWGNDWQTNWKFLQTIYEQKPTILKEIKDVLLQEFEPRVYSVLSCAKVGTVEQYILAVLEKQDEEQEQKDETEKKTDKKKKSDDQEKKSFVIKKIYWI